MTEEELEKMIIEMREKGHSFRDISKELGVSNREIAKVLRDHEKKKLVNDPISILEERAEQEERRVKAIKRLQKAKEQLEEPGLINRLIAFEFFVVKKIEEIESRLNKLENVKINGCVKSFKDEIGDLVELQKLNMLELENRRRMWGF